MHQQGRKHHHNHNLKFCKIRQHTKVLCTFLGRAVAEAQASHSQYHITLRHVTITTHYLHYIDILNGY